jgi:hypothetical protein
MATHYKGHRIAELLQDIDRLSKELEESKEDFENETQAIRAIEAETLLAIAKAKLTALQGENNAD